MQKSYKNWPKAGSFACWVQALWHSQFQGCLQDHFLQLPVNGLPCIHVWKHHRNSQLLTALSVLWVFSNQTLDNCLTGSSCLIVIEEKTKTWNVGSNCQISGWSLDVLFVSCCAASLNKGSLPGIHSRNQTKQCISGGISYGWTFFFKIHWT